MYSLDTNSTSTAANDTRIAVGGGTKNIYFGDANSGIGPVPQWVWIAAAVGAAVWLIKTKF